MTCYDCLFKFAGTTAITLLAVYVGKILYRLIYPFFIATPLDLHKLSGGGKYAVVTGSTDGIGKAYALQLAKKGFNIVLISRSDSKLQSVKKEINDQVPDIDVQTVAFDFTNSSVKDYENIIFKKLQSIEVGVLVNNVGMTSEYPEIHHKTAFGTQKNRDIHVVNTLAPTILTQEVLTQMVPRKGGVIINIGSMLGEQPISGFCVYSSTKKYMSHLSQILDKEYSAFDITVQYISPCLVATNMSKREETSFFAASSTDFVKSALRTVGNIKETSGYFSHQIQVEAFNLMPSFVLDYVFKHAVVQMRANYEKRAANKAKNN
uniref:Estradiol 17-beta-dehydrogenase 12 n=1 Tax=Rhabditophanes sp. KR3021 TaxID=114890 RepID=A0AC35U953_9BILA